MNTIRQQFSILARHCSGLCLGTSPGYVGLEAVRCNWKKGEYLSTEKYVLATEIFRQGHVDIDEVVHIDFRLAGVEDLWGCITKSTQVADDRAEGTACVTGILFGNLRMLRTGQEYQL